MGKYSANITKPPIDFYSKLPEIVDVTIQTYYHASLCSVTTVRQRGALTKLHVNGSIIFIFFHQVSLTKVYFRYCHISCTVWGSKKEKILGSLYLRLDCGWGKNFGSDLIHYSQDNVCMRVDQLSFANLASVEAPKPRQLQMH